MSESLDYWRLLNVPCVSQLIGGVAPGQTSVIPLHTKGCFLHSAAVIIVAFSLLVSREWALFVLGPYVGFLLAIEAIVTLSSCHSVITAAVGRGRVFPIWAIGARLSLLLSGLSQLIKRYYIIVKISMASLRKPSSLAGQPV